MTMYYFAGFDVAALGAGTLTVGTSGHTSIVCDLGTVAGPDQNSIGSSLFFGYPINGTWKVQGEDPNGTTRLPEYSSESYQRSLRTKLRALAITASWGTTLANSIDVQGYFYQITCNNPITLVWSNAVGRALMGFSADRTSANASQSGNVTPTYAIVPTLSMTSQHSVDYEPDAIANHVHADDGRGFGISRSVSPLYRDWIQQFETKAKSKRLSASSSDPWTFQHLFEHCRGEFPFVTSQGFGESFDEVFSLRTEGTSFRPERAGADKLDDGHWHIPFKTVIEGKVVQLT